LSTSSGVGDVDLDILASSSSADKNDSPLVSVLIAFRAPLRSSSDFRRPFLRHLFWSELGQDIWRGAGNHPARSVGQWHDAEVTQIAASMHTPLLNQVGGLASEIRFGYCEDDAGSMSKDRREIPLMRQPLPPSFNIEVFISVPLR
jgi:hypothetical protein